MKILKVIQKYLFNVLISIDQLGNTLAGGDPDETISSRLGKHFKNSEFRKFVDLLFGKKHCENVIEPDEGDNTVLK